MTRRARLLIAIAIVVFSATGTRAYLKLGGQGTTGIVSLKWTTPIAYFVSNQDVPNVTANDLAGAIAQAFGTWAAVPNIGIAPRFSGLTSAPPINGDNMTVIGFQDHPELDRTLGQTTFSFDGVTGDLIEADIFLNSEFAWSVAPGGEANRYDAQSIVTHEIGHLLGLAHSALGETELVPTGRRVIAKQAVMFPIAFPPGTVLDRTLDADDIAGITDVYSNPTSMRTLGEITGHVTLDGVGLFGAHVIVSNAVTGTLTGGFTLDADGTFVIASLTPGLYLVRVEPLDDADVSSFFSSSTVVNLNFQQTYSPRLVPVPAGGAGAPVTIAVVPK